MKRWTRLILFALAVCLLFTQAAPARAEVMTLGVYFRGLAEKEDGTTEQIPLEGSFRVLQGGMLRGTIQAGVTTVTLDGSDPVTVEPMAETIAPGWDLTGVRVTIPMTDGGNVTVPILVSPLKEGTVAEVPAAQEVPAAETGTETAENGPVEVFPVETVPGAAADVTAAPTAVPVATPTPEWNNQTPVPTATPTAEPQVGKLQDSPDKGTFHIKVFYDGNDNGECSVYEKGVEGIPVYLVSETDEVVTGGTTDAEGEITLPGVEPGTWRIRVSLPEKWGFNRKAKDVGLNRSVMDFSEEGTQDSEPIKVSAGETVERGVGLLKGGMADGVCWLDVNANGIMESGEPRVAGARVTLNGQKNGLEYEAYSDADGYWRVIRLRPGSYDFTSYAPEGMMFTRYSKTGGVNRSVFTAEGRTRSTKTLDLNDGRTAPNQNIGFTWQGVVSGIAFLDANYNGLYDEGEAPLPGVKVAAVKQSKDEEVASALTDENGRYTLGGLRGNTYKIRAVLPDDGCTFTVAVSEPEGNHFTARDGRRENFWRDFVLADGESRVVNVGAIYYGSISGKVYLDDDFSGSMNGSEKVAQGIQVTLLNANGTQVDMKKTNAKGTYTFTGLTPGMYTMRMTAKEGYAFTRRGEGNVMLNLNGGEGCTEPFEVPLGANLTDMDAGMIRPATVKGRVFADRNDNGKSDGSEDGLAGTTVRLMSEEDGEAFSAVLTETGEFLFDAVMPGRYYVEYQLPDGAVFARGGGDNTISGENGLGRGESFDIHTADVKEVPLCGGLTLGRISGIVFHDHDGSGTMDADDAPLAGARVTLTPARADQDTAEAETGADGVFDLESLRPGTYQLKVTLPEGMATTRTGSLTLPLVQGKQDQEVSLEISMGQTWTDQRIGAVIPAVLRGRVWLDENNNGLLEPEERTPAGLELVITDEESGERFSAVRTDDGGVFEEAGLAPGTYTVSYQLDAESDAPPAGDNTFRKEDGRMVMTGIVVKEGETRDGLTLGLVKYTAMGGMVWIDRGNGAEPLAEAEVRLLGAENQVLESAVTGETGAWRFSGLMPGEYRIEAHLPEGIVAAEPDDERLETGLISVLRETDGRTGRSDPIDLKMGEDQLSLNIGSVLPGTIGDFCWLDLNKNGLQDGGELGIPHVKVELVRNGVTVAETETDQYGLYFFREVYPAVYTLKVTAPDEVKPTQKRTDIYLIVSSLVETEENTAVTEEFAVASDSTDFNIDLGYVLRTEGRYPAGYGEQETMDWSIAYEGVELK